MPCAFPPEPDEIQLLAYLDRDEAPEVATHMRGCPYCQARARRLAGLQGRLTSQFYRVGCPTSLELGDYHLGVLSKDRAVAVARHLSDCAFCSQELAQLQGFLADLRPEIDLSRGERARETVRVLVARLTEGLDGGLSSQPAFAPVYAALRGAEEGPVIYTAEDVQIVIEIQGEAEGGDRKTILALATGLSEPAASQAHLWREEHPVATVSLDDLGNFAIGDLAPGAYELILSSPEIEIHVQQLQV